MDYLRDERVSPKVEGLVLGSLVTSSPSGRFSVYKALIACISVTQNYNTMAESQVSFIETSKGKSAGLRQEVVKSSF